MEGSQNENQNPHGETIHSYRNNKNGVFWNKSSNLIRCSLWIKNHEIEMQIHIKVIKLSYCPEEYRQALHNELLCSHDPSRSIDNQTTLTQSLSQTFKLLFQLCPCILISCSSSNVVMQVLQIHAQGMKAASHRRDIPTQRLLCTAHFLSTTFLWNSHYKAALHFKSHLLVLCRTSVTPTLESRTFELGLVYTHSWDESNQCHCKWKEFSNNSKLSFYTIYIYTKPLMHWTNNLILAEN